MEASALRQLHNRGFSRRLPRRVGEVIYNALENVMVRLVSYLPHAREGETIATLEMPAWSAILDVA
jgi:hypothetical protein